MSGVVPAKKKHKDYESAMARLEEITALLEGGEVSLEESIGLYTEGLEIAKECHAKLDEAEQKIRLIVTEQGEESEVDFESSETEE